MIEGLELQLCPIAFSLPGASLVFAPKMAQPRNKTTEGAARGLVPHLPTPAGHRLGSNAIERTLFLQQTIGNQATLRLLSQLTALTSPSFLQPKLVVGEVNDPLEREADRIADHVMRTPDPAVGIGWPASPQIQRLCPECTEELQRRSFKEARFLTQEEEIVQIAPPAPG
jgi:hypothetical protein